MPPPLSKGGVGNTRTTWQGQEWQHTHPSAGLVRDEVTGLAPELHTAAVIQLHTQPAQQ